jgi:hypothetical protein
MLFAPHGEAGPMQSIAQHNQYESLRDHTEAIALLAAIGARIPRTRVFCCLQANWREYSIGFWEGFCHASDFNSYCIRNPNRFGFDQLQRIRRLLGLLIRKMPPGLCQGWW